MTLAIAFKEWAVICRALAEGRQSVILRKGGIAEEGGQFRPEHDRFLLYPTFFHEQHRTGIKPEFVPLLDAAERAKPAAGTTRFTHYAEVVKLFQITEFEKTRALGDFHGWTAEEVTKRFYYRKPGLFAFAVRLYHLPAPVEVVERPEYAGCKSWVQLDSTIPTGGSAPVLTDEAFAEVLEKLNAAVG